MMLPIRANDVFATRKIMVKMLTHFIEYIKPQIRQYIVTFVKIMILKQTVGWKTLHITHKAVVHYPLCESSGYVKQAKAGKPPQI